MSEQSVPMRCPFEGCAETVEAIISTVIDGPDHKGRVDVYVNVEGVSDATAQHFQDAHPVNDRDNYGDFLPKAGISVWPGQMPARR